MIEIRTEYTFEAAHALTHLPEGHKCRRLHGHNYIARLHIAGEPDPALGWVQDFGEIDAAAQAVIGRLDHQYLNDVLPCLTTAENIAAWLFKELRPALPLLVAVEVCETPQYRVTYREATT